MSFLRRLFKRPTKPGPAASTLHHVAYIEFEYGGLDPGPLFELESRLEAQLRASGAGVYVGNQMATDGSRGRMTLYGCDADRLLDLLRSARETSAFLQGARVSLRYGPDRPGVHERQVVLD